MSTRTERHAHVSSSKADIAAPAVEIDFAGLIGPVSRRLLGEPNRSLSTSHQLRFGSRGSMAVEVGGERRGTWFDHEANQGGGLLDLLRREKGLVNGEALNWLRAEFGGHIPELHVSSQGASGSPKRIVATYDYSDAGGELVFQVVRYEPKNFRQRRPNGNGEWFWNVHGTAPIPYRLPKLLEHRHGPVFVVEGEKDVESLERLGLTATCNPGGAAKEPKDGKPYKAKWPASFAGYFQGKEVIVLPDNDEAGRAHAAAVAESLRGTAAQVRVLTLPGLPPKGDVSNWVEAGGDRELLLALVESMPEFGGQAASESEPVEDVELVPLDIGSDAEIARRVSEDLERQHGPVVFTEGEFWHYSGTHWEPLPIETLWLTACRYDGAVYSPAGGRQSVVKLGKSRVESILACMKPALTRRDFFAEVQEGINCISGFIEISGTGAPRLLPHSPDHRCRHVLPGRWPLVAGRVGRPLLETLLEGCFRGDDDRVEKIDLLGEIAGVAALGAATRLIDPKAVVLLGEQAENGKSEVLNALRALLPRQAVSSISPARFGDPTFVCHLAGKLLNVTDELASSSAIASEVFKQAVTGEPMMARDVYRSAFDFRPAAQHVYATNSLPDFKGGMDRGVRRRLLVIPFNRVIPRSERIEHIGIRIGREEPDLLLDWAVRGAARVMAKRRFTEPKSCAERLREWMSASNPVLAWLDSGEVCYSGNGVVPETRTKEAYPRFRRWAMDEGYEERQLPALNLFSQRVLAAGKGVTRRRDNKGALFVGLGITRTAAENCGGC